MIEALRHCGGIFPRVRDGFILRRVMKPETLCPFEERTGVVNFRRFGYDAEVTFQDEPDNPADREAVKVLADGLFIGYFYRSSTLRQLLRGIRRTDGIRYLARIVHTDRVVRFEVAIYVCFLPEEYDLIGTYKTISMKEVDCPVGTLFPLSGPSCPSSTTGIWMSSAIRPALLSPGLCSRMKESRWGWSISAPASCLTASRGRMDCLHVLRSVMARMLWSPSSALVVHPRGSTSSEYSFLDSTACAALPISASLIRNNS